MILAVFLTLFVVMLEGVRDKFRTVSNSTGLLPGATPDQFDSTLNALKQSLAMPETNLSFLRQAPDAPQRPAPVPTTPSLPRSLLEEIEMGEAELRKLKKLVQDKEAALEKKKQEQRALDESVEPLLNQINLHGVSVETLLKYLQKKSDESK